MRPKPTPSPAHLSETLAPGAASTSVGRALPAIPACGVVTPELRFPPRPLAAGLPARERRGKRPGGAGLCLRRRRNESTEASFLPCSGGPSLAGEG